MTEAQLVEGLVVSTTRRAVNFLQGHQQYRARASSKTLEVLVGDRIVCEARGDEFFLKKIHPRRNCFGRTIQGKRRDIAANVDCIYIVVSILPVINTLFVDRVLAVAATEGLSCQLIVNKIDLELDALRGILAVYEALGVKILPTSAKFGQGVEALRAELQKPSWQVVALCGVSGVGKSTILNAIVPEAERAIGELSARTGQGRQTTTQAVGHLMRREHCEDLLVVDLPGTSQFGVEHLRVEDVTAAFVDIAKIAAECPFDNCSHIGEQECAVKEAVETGQLSPTRFASYIEMVSEIRAAKPY